MFYLVFWSSNCSNNAVTFLTLDDRLLEIGFGRGDGLKLVYDKLNEGRGNGCVFGLEASEYMLHLSNKRFTVEVTDEGTIVLDCVIFHF